ncbi:MAG: hypothetical protein RLZZ401_167 [Pseudomonadota bacterium]
MKKILAFAALGIAVGAAFAQPVQPGGASPDPAHKVQPRAAERFKRLDSNSDGAINREEAATRPRLKENFDLIDTNKDGKLTPDELRAFARQHQGPRGADRAGSPKP